MAVTPNDPLFAQQWNMTQIKAGGAGSTGWDISTGVPSIVVCVLDQGCDLNHQDLRFSTPGININGSTQSGDGSPVANSRHGTNCAGIVAATYNNGLDVAGVAGNCRIMSVATQNFNDIELAAGINWATSQGARVINISLAFPPGFDSNGIINTAILSAFNNNVVICAATGNTNSSINVIFYPANEQNVIAVGASDRNDNRVINGVIPISDNNGTWNSHYGTRISVVAPGVDIPTTDLGNQYRMDFWGASAATAHVAGLAALILSVNPNLTNVQVRDIIERTAEKVGSVPYANVVGHPNGSWNPQMGYGRINVLQALMLAMPAGGDSTPPSTPTGLRIN